MTDKKTVSVFVLGIIAMVLYLSGSAAHIISQIMMDALGSIENVLTLIPTLSLYFVMFVLLMKLLSLDGVALSREKNGRLAAFARCLTGRKWRLAISIVFFVFAGLCLAFFTYIVIYQLLIRDAYFRDNRSIMRLYYISEAIGHYLSRAVLFATVALAMLPPKAKPSKEKPIVAGNIIVEAKPDESASTLDWHA